jgi:hypothetical protein
MFAMRFEICPRGHQAQWIVRLGKSFYGSYLSREQALLDAVDAARDAVQAGHDAQVWVKDRSTMARVF